MDKEKIAQQAIIDKLEQIESIFNKLSDSRQAVIKREFYNKLMTMDIYKSDEPIIINRDYLDYEPYYGEEQTF